MDINNIDKISYLTLSAIKNTLYARNTKIQKLIYIYEEEVDQGLFRKTFDDFISYHFGPFSKELWKIIDLLIANNLIKDMGKEGYKLSKKGEVILKKLEEGNIDIDFNFWNKICKIFRETGLNKLLKYVYKLYPELLEKSIIIDELEYKEADYEWIRATKQNIAEFKKNMENSSN